MAHRPLLEGTGEAVRGHGVFHRGRAVLHAFADASEVGGSVHVLHATGDRHVDVPGLDRAGGLHDGFQSGAADLVDGHCGDGVGDPGGEGGLAGRVLADAGLQHATHEHFVDRVGGNGGVGEGGLDRDSAELRGRDSGHR